MTRIGRATRAVYPSQRPKSTKLRRARSTASSSPSPFRHESIPRGLVLPRPPVVTSKHSSYHDSGDDWEEGECVPIRVLLPGMKAPITTHAAVLEKHTMLPDHQPSLLRGKPVRVSLPGRPPRCCYPSTDRSFMPMQLPAKHANSCIRCGDIRDVAGSPHCRKCMLQILSNNPKPPMRRSIVPSQVWTSTVKHETEAAIRPTAPRSFRGSTRTKPSMDFRALAAIPVSTEAAAPPIKVEKTMQKTRQGKLNNVPSQVHLRVHRSPPRFCPMPQRYSRTTVLHRCQRCLLSQSICTSVHLVDLLAARVATA
ncbi:hypothetical protein BJ546DRAFT_1111755 [Cryomyces antarcticus]